MEDYKYHYNDYAEKEIELVEEHNICVPKIKEVSK